MQVGHRFGALVPLGLHQGGGLLFHLVVSMVMVMVTGTANSDIMYGFGGEDTLNGGDGDDWLHGGDGGDRGNGGGGLYGARRGARIVPSYPL